LRVIEQARYLLVIPTMPNLSAVPDEIPPPYAHTPQNQTKEEFFFVFLNLHDE